MNVCQRQLVKEMLGPLVTEFVRNFDRENATPYQHSFNERIAASEEGVPALFGGVVSLDLINALATDRTKANMNPPTTVPYITEAGTPACDGIRRRFFIIAFVALRCGARPASERPLVWITGWDDLLWDTMRASRGMVP